MIVNETENAANQSFDGAHAVLPKPTKKMLAQTAPGGKIYAKPVKQNIAPNPADLYSSVDKARGKGFSAINDVYWCL